MSDDSDRIRILCAESLTHGAEALSVLGDVSVLPDGEITAARARAFDALAIRSKTRVDDDYFSGGTRLRFIGTATAGTDHLAVSHPPADARIVSASGCNANSVAEYVVATLLELAHLHRWSLRDRVLGIVGHGHVGRAVEQRVRSLGMRCLLNDPPVEATRGGDYISLEQLLAESDVVTLHVPLVEEGPWPTRRLLGATEFQHMREGAWLINACRGEVVDNPSLVSAVAAGRPAEIALDVWDPEPLWPRALDAVARFGTPHIAGHSWEGKWNGTLMVARELARWAGLPDPTAELERRFRPRTRRVRPRVTDGDPQTVIRDVVRQAYDVASDSRELRKGLPLPDSERSAWFNRLRKHYPPRPEFRNVRVRGVDESIVMVLQGLGFVVESDPGSHS